MKSAPQLRNVQMLRALAAMSVVLQHALHDSDSLTATRLTPVADHSWFNFGFGVDIFFVISGFIMAYTAAGDFGAPGAPWRFFSRRVARVVPLYWVLTSAMILGAMIAPSLLNVPIGGLPHILASYLFIPDARLPGEIRPVLALGWTLNYEMYFYVLFALVLFVPLRAGVMALSAVMLALAAIGGILDPPQTQIGFWTDPIILDFLFGIYVALAWRAGVRINGVLAAAAAIAGIAGFLHLWSGVGTAVPRWLSTGIPATLLVCAAVLGPPVRLGRLTAVAVALGNASYSLYLIHPFVVRPLRALWGKLVGEQLPPVVFVAVCCAASGVVAILVYRLIERPLTLFVQGLLGRKGPSGHKQDAMPHPDPIAAPPPPAAPASTPARGPASAPPPARGLLVSVRGIERSLLFLLTASGFLAFVEPSPYEFVFAIVLVVFAFSGGLRMTAWVLPLLFCAIGFSLGGFISLVPFISESDAMSFTLISAYMCVTAVFYAMLLGVDAPARLDALRNGYVLAALLASIAGIIGYFQLGDFLGPLTRYGRAAGTFKDPNVLGTFVILPLVYLVRSMLVTKVRITTAACVLTILFGGVFLSFSRGAWIHAVGSLFLMSVLTYLASSSRGVRRRIVSVAIGGALLVAAALPVVLSVKSINTVFETRASFDQSYDLGAQGRFGNQANSIPMLLERPNGFGPHRFNTFFPEDPHEVYINAFASYGWLGGFSYLALITMTVMIGWRIATADFPLRGHAIVIWSTLFVQIIQGLQIDTDHWRHFWLMLGLTWGMLPVLTVGRRSAPARPGTPAGRPGREQGFAPPVAAARSVNAGRTAEAAIRTGVARATPLTARGTPSDARHGTRFEGVDLLRILAALAVMFYHYAFRGAAGGGFTTFQSAPLAPVAQYGYLGVELFFMISGFLITRSAERQSVGGFIRARILRIYPLFVVAMTTTSVAAALIGAPRFAVSPSDWLANLTLFAPAFGHPFVDGVYWTLTLEIVFYGWIAMLIGLGWFETRRRLVVTVWLAASLAVNAATSSKAAHTLLLSDFSALFASGMLIYDIKRYGFDAWRYGLLALAAVMAAGGVLDRASYYRDELHASVSSEVLVMIVVALYATFLAALAVPRLGRAGPLLALLGATSYPLYLMHENIGFMLFNLIGDRLTMGAAALVVTLTVGTAALFLAAIVEPVARRLAARLLDAGPLRRLGARPSSPSGQPSWPRSGIALP